jgi:hypothetical protein
MAEKGKGKGKPQKRIRVDPALGYKYEEMFGTDQKCIDPVIQTVLNEAMNYCITETEKKMKSSASIFSGLDVSNPSKLLQAWKTMWGIQQQTPCPPPIKSTGRVSGIPPSSGVPPSTGSGEAPPSTAGGSKEPTQQEKDQAEAVITSANAEEAAKKTKAENEKTAEQTSATAAFTVALQNIKKTEQDVTAMAKTIKEEIIKEKGIVTGTGAIIIPPTPPSTEFKKETVVETRKPTIERGWFDVKKTQQIPSLAPGNKLKIVINPETETREVYDDLGPFKLTDSNYNKQLMEFMPSDADEMIEVTTLLVMNKEKPQAAKTIAAKAKAVDVAGLILKPITRKATQEEMTEGLKPAVAATAEIATETGEVKFADGSKLENLRLDATLFGKDGKRYSLTGKGANGYTMTNPDGISATMDLKALLFTMRGFENAPSTAPVISPEEAKLIEGIMALETVSMVSAGAPPIIKEFVYVETDANGNPLSEERFKVYLTNDASQFGGPIVSINSPLGKTMRSAVAGDVLPTIHSDRKFKTIQGWKKIISVA